MATSKLLDVMHTLTENHLKCTICLSTFMDPRILHCNHSYCLPCLQNLQTQPLEDEDLYSQIKCPICREMTSLNEMGAEGLKRNFTLKSLQDDIIYYQNLCSDEPTAACTCRSQRQDCWKDTDSLQSSNLKQNSMEMLHSQPKTQCQRHPGQEYCFYCLTYSVLICPTCAATMHTDSDHIHLELDEAEKTCKTELMDLLSQTLDTLCHLTAIKSLIENERDKMKDLVDAVITQDVKRILEKFREEQDQDYSLLLSSANSKVEWAAQTHFSVLKKVTDACMNELLETREELVLRLNDVIQKELPVKYVPRILEIKLQSKLKFGSAKHTCKIHITKADCNIDKEGNIVVGKPQTKTIK